MGYHRPNYFSQVSFPSPRTLGVPLSLPDHETLRVQPGERASRKERFLLIEGSSFYSPLRSHYAPLVPKPLLPEIDKVLGTRGPQRGPHS